MEQKLFVSKIDFCSNLCCIIGSFSILPLCFYSICGLLHSKVL